MRRTSIFLLFWLAWSSEQALADPRLRCDGIGFVTTQPVFTPDSGFPRGPVRLSAGRASVGSACPPARARIEKHRHHLALHVRWPRCVGLTGVVRLAARIDPDCTSLTGTLRAPRSGLRLPIVAAQSRCGDGVVDPERGEACEREGCPVGRQCVDCACAPVFTTTTSKPPDTTTTSSTTTTSTVTTSTTLASGLSVARQWDEEILAAIRRDTPRPTVHARNLFHLSAAMWDAWAAYDATGTQYFVRERATATDIEAARAEALSYAAYRLLRNRYQDAVGKGISQQSFDDRMDSLGYDRRFTSQVGATPAALGNRIAAAALAYGKTDDANEDPEHTYRDGTYAPVNIPLIVQIPLTTIDRPADPNRWQPLYLGKAVTQNGIEAENVQTFIGSHWGRVSPFALVKENGADIYLDPGPPPRLEGGVNDVYHQSAVDILRLSGELSTDDGEMIDISPGAVGNNTLGTNDGHGHVVNCATGGPYAKNRVKRGDWARVLAEFWADGPTSETPPGHWNVLANQASDALTDRRLGGTGPALTRLEWDVKLYFALNGALHDAAIGAWGTKRKYDSARPITMVRYLGFLGQGSDPSAPHYDPNGLPLVPGLIELVTAATTAAGERHEALAGHEGAIAVFTWPGQPADPKTQASGRQWIRADSWVPYQKNTFVTPAFAAYTSGHSTFSRAAAEVLTAFTGTSCVPGGLGHFLAPRDTFLSFEHGPSTDVDLQWATYYDAADNAGRSRLYGGIHIEADDLRGRVMGSTIGTTAAARALRYFDGSVVP